jgi:predicted transglutaminase-like protease
LEDEAAIAISEDVYIFHLPLPPPRSLQQYHIIYLREKYVFCSTGGQLNGKTLFPSDQIDYTCYKNI